MYIISWPTKRLLMAEVTNEHNAVTGNTRDGRSLPGGVTPATLEAALDSVHQGHEPYAGFPAAFVAEELKLLIQQYGLKYEASELLTERDWKYRDLGREPVVVVLDPDLGEYLIDFIRCNADLQQDGYANQLFEYGVQRELGVGDMLVNALGGVKIAGHLVERGSKVWADPVAGQCQRRRVTYQHPQLGPITGELDVADLLTLEEAEQDRQLLLQRAEQALAGLNVAVQPMAQEGEAGGRMLRVACEPNDEATFKQAKRRLKQAGLVAYNVKFHPGVLHVRGNN